MAIGPNPATWCSSPVAIVVWLIFSATWTGCVGPVLVKHPKTPMLILESRGKVRVAVENSSGDLIEYGWVAVPEGWTLVDYDWQNRF